MPQLPVSSAPTSLVMLTHKHSFCRKKIMWDAQTQTATIQGYDKGKEWTPKVIHAGNLRELLARLSDMAIRKRSMLVQGALIDEHATYIPRVKNGPAPTLKEAERLWLPVDIDALDAEGETLTEKLFWLRDTFMPEPFHGVECIYQLTSRQGINDDKLYARLWFWLSKPVATPIWRQFFRPIAGIDESIYHACQPIYTAEPELLGFASSPLPSGVARIDLMAETGGGPVVDVAALGLPSSEAVAARLRAQRQGVVLSRCVTPDQIQIEDTIARVRAQTTSGARHHHALAVACELYALGADVDTVSEVCADVLQRQGREPNDDEINGILRYVADKAKSGDLHTTNAPIEQRFAQLQAQDALESAGTGGSLGELFEDIQAQMPYSDELTDFQNAAVASRRLWSGGTDLVTLDGNLYAWTPQHGHWRNYGPAWGKGVGAAYLTGEIARDAGAGLSTFRNIQAAAARLATVRTTSTYDAKPGEWFTDDTFLRTERKDTFSAQYILPFSNGHLHAHMLRDAPEEALRPASKWWFNTSLLPTPYDRSAECPRWLQFLEEVLPRDTQAQRELQKLMGYLLTRDRRHQKVWLLQGRAGTGKSTIFNVIRMLLGEDKCTSPSLAQFGDKHLTGDWLGKQAVLVEEANDERAMAKGQEITMPAKGVDIIKTISGGGPINVRPISVNPMSVDLPIRFVLFCNTAPGFPDSSGAIMRRLITFHFNQVFENESYATKGHTKARKGDGDLTDKFRRELTGIMAWAVQGLMLLQEDAQFFQPESGAHVREDIRRLSDPVGAFAAECLEFGLPTDEDYRTPSREAYHCYTEWAGAQNLQTLNQPHLLRMLCTRFGVMEQKNDRNKPTLYGVRLAGHAVAEYASGGDAL